MYRWETRTLQGLQDAVNHSKPPAIAQDTDITQPVLLSQTCLALLPAFSHPSDKRFEVSLSAMFTDAKFFSNWLSRKVQCHQSVERYINHFLGTVGHHLLLVSWMTAKKSIFHSNQGTGAQDLVHLIFK
jgi:hypothetical protein